ncbi:uncharacterized protein LOC108681405 isoform X2 [Hyalella azteca]|uniref:Uncharacterized protein LOC108681405 isoform X2 n=1 Tax=Hyalella azteca TaxID=294128 RepID=A0A8B7PKF4_HYAAZ|nr:uncharacterized protein LOC108681405 isoform X2 [Hyalella azteca]
MASKRDSEPPSSPPPFKQSKSDGVSPVPKLAQTTLESGRNHGNENTSAALVNTAADDAGGTAALSEWLPGSGAERSAVNADPLLELTGTESGRNLGNENTSAALVNTAADDAGGTAALSERLPGGGAERSAVNAASLLELTGMESGRNLGNENTSAALVNTAADDAGGTAAPSEWLPGSGAERSAASAAPLVEMTSSGPVRLISPIVHQETSNHQSDNNNADGTDIFNVFSTNDCVVAAAGEVASEGSIELDVDIAEQADPNVQALMDSLLTDETLEQMPHDSLLLENDMITVSEGPRELNLAPVNAAEEVNRALNILESAEHADQDFQAMNDAVMNDLRPEQMPPDHPLLENEIINVTWRPRSPSPEPVNPGEQFCI